MAKNKSKKTRGEGLSNHKLNGGIKMINSSIKKDTVVQIKVASDPLIGQSSKSILSSREAAIVGQVAACCPDVIGGVIPFGVTRGNEGVNSGAENSAGFIFMCSEKTKPECFQYRVSGLPMGKLEVVKKIQPGMKLFLYDFDLKLLYGIYEATSHGQLNLELMAFAQRFPSQVGLSMAFIVNIAYFSCSYLLISSISEAKVQFRIFKGCLPVPESVFKHAIKENYYSSSKFKQELHINQVNCLMELFRPIDLTPPPSSTLHPWNRLPPAAGTCISWNHHNGALHLPQNFQLENAHSNLLYKVYVPQSQVGVVRSVAEPQDHVQEIAQVPSNEKLHGPHPPYVTEDPRLSGTATCGRVAVAAEMALAQQDIRCVNGLPSVAQTGACLNHVVNYYIQQAQPAPASHAPVSAATLPYGSVPSYVQLPHYAHWESSSSSYQHYTHDVQAQSYGTVPLAANTFGSVNSSNNASATFSSWDSDGSNSIPFLWRGD